VETSGTQLVLDAPRELSDASAEAVSIFVFVDALGWEVVRRHPWFLRGLADARGPLETVLGYSCTCDPTILTGRLPREHGHFSFFRFDPDASPFRGMDALRALPRFLRERGRVRHWISRLLGSKLGFTGYFQLYGVPFELLRFLDYTERKDLYEPGGIIGGQDTVFDRFRASEVSYHRSDWRRPEVYNLARAEEALEEDRPRCIYLYLAELDGVMHATGTRGSGVEEKLREYDRALRDLVRRASGLYSEVRLHVFSDHGMTDVIGTVGLRSAVEDLGLSFGTEYAAVYDSTMARFWFPDPVARDRVLALLREEPRGRILEESELAELGCDFPDRRYGEVIFLLEPGYVFDPSFMGSWVPSGMHGYHPSHPDSRAAYFCSHPGLALPQHLTDLYDVMLADAGVRS
jgi:predicted AlkP superfamily pyrophosphatase or phosphodiesterase